MKALLFLLATSLMVVFGPTPAQASDSLPTTVVVDTNCDQRAPRVQVTIQEGARRLGFGPANSDAIVWVDTRGVRIGEHSITLPQQPFGSTRTWVMVADYRDQPHGLVTSRDLRFTRPAKASCVVKQNPRITKYGSGTNVACKAGFDKMVIATLVVRGPGYIAAPGMVELVKKNDRPLYSRPKNTDLVGGKGGPQRMVEYYFFVGNRVRFKLDPSENGIWPVKTSSASVKLVASLDARCMSQEL